MNDKQHNISIFQEYYEDKPFVDRYLSTPDHAIDVIIPIIHANELWKANLMSFYREIPIHKLIIGDGGCIDDSMSIAEGFPRAQIFDHRSYKSLGYSIRKLIEAVETEWFAYIHADAYLPAGWFDAMEKHQQEYDWFGCPMQHTVMIEYNVSYGERPWAGTQMGRKKAFDSGLSRVDDDYVYRQEDYVFSDIVAKAGYREGKISDTFHYHQTMQKQTPWSRHIKSVNFDLEISPEEEIRTCMTMAKGIVKYLDPPVLAEAAVLNIDRLVEMGVFSWRDFMGWVKAENPDWVPVLKRQRLAMLPYKLKPVLRTIRNILGK